MSARSEQSLDRGDKLQQVKVLMLSLVPAGGSPIGNTALRREIEARLAADGVLISEEDY